MVSSMLEGFEAVDPHDDDSQLNFALKCFDCAYRVLTSAHRAHTELQTQEIEKFWFGPVLAIESANDDLIKYAQKTGVMVVIKKDPETGALRIKARPDCPIDLLSLYKRILTVDQSATWYYHPSGKMLLNGSRKHSSQKPSKLPLNEVMHLFREIYSSQ